jgi:hypothetical protein
MDTFPRRGRLSNKLPGRLWDLLLSMDCQGNLSLAL